MQPTHPSEGNGEDAFFASADDSHPLLHQHSVSSPPDWWDRTEEPRASIYLQQPVTLVLSAIAIMVWQFQGPIVRWYQNRIQWIFHDAENVGTFQLVWDTMVSLLVAVLDYLRAAYQMALEVLRRILLWICGWCGYGGTVEPANGSLQLPVRQRSRCNSLPALQECTTVTEAGAEAKMDDNMDGDTSLATVQQFVEHVPASLDVAPVDGWCYHLPLELEPAFLHAADYPTDWMVYHPILGVVSKTRADLYHSAGAAAAAAAGVHVSLESTDATTASPVNNKVDTLPTDTTTPLESNVTALTDTTTPLESNALVAPDPTIPLASNAPVAPDTTVPLVPVAPDTTAPLESNIIAPDDTTTAVHETNAALSPSAGQTVKDAPYKSQHEEEKKDDIGMCDLNGWTNETGIDGHARLPSPMAPASDLVT